MARSCCEAQKRIFKNQALKVPYCRFPSANICIPPKGCVNLNKYPPPKGGTTTILHVHMLRSTKADWSAKPDQSALIQRNPLFGIDFVENSHSLSTFYPQRHLFGEEFQNCCGICRKIDTFLRKKGWKLSPNSEI